ncbi:MAG: hypothetical protein WDM77_01730 [Steroidobacteraceae bacterium]
MIARVLGPPGLLVTAVLSVSAARAGVWGTDPSMGLSADYASNPLLLELPHTSETNAAVLLDAPTSFTGNAFQLTIDPSFRISDTSSYDSVNSDYDHLTVRGEYDTDLNKVAVSGGLSRDSSLYQNYLVNGESGVRRDGILADMNWERHLTERLDFTTDLDATRVRYDEGSGPQVLVDYDYATLSPTLTWSATERTKLNLSVQAGLYKSLDGDTRSESANAQIGVTTKLNELWTLTASGGYSTARNRLNLLEPLLVLTPDGLEIEYLPLHLDSSQNSSVFSVSIVRVAQRLNLSASASRQEVPTGFSYLSRQDIFQFTADYTLTPRWSVGAGDWYLKSLDPGAEGTTFDRNLNSFSARANWQWTEHWTLAVSMSHVTENEVGQRLKSNQVALTVMRQFNHISF